MRRSAETKTFCVTSAQNVTQTATQPGNVVPDATKTVTDAVNDVGATVGGAPQDAGNTVGGLLKP